MGDKWFEVSCQVPAILADTISAQLSNLSGNGVCTENLQVDAFSTSEIPESTVITIKAYFSEPPETAAYIDEIEQILKQLADQERLYRYVPPTVSTVQTEDWSNSWKVNFKPLRIGHRLLIVPSWEEIQQNDNDCVLRIDPGMAFGTGGHETTRLCLELLEEILDSMPTMTIPTLLDLGTGSGILAMAAVKLGAGRVWAVDIDPLAIEVAVENIAINELSDQIQCDTTPLEAIHERFDILLANILAEELVRLSPALAERLETGGNLVLSGILAEKETLVRNGFAPCNLEYLETRHSGEWVAIHYRKRCEE